MPDVQSALVSPTRDCDWMVQPVPVPTFVTAPVNDAADQAAWASLSSVPIRSGTVQYPPLGTARVSVVSKAHWAVAVEERITVCPPNSAPMYGVIAWKVALTDTLTEEPNVAALEQWLAASEYSVVTLPDVTTTNPPRASATAASAGLAPPPAANSAASRAALVTEIRA